LQTPLRGGGGRRKGEKGRVETEKASSPTAYACEKKRRKNLRNGSEKGRRRYASEERKKTKQIERSNGKSPSENDVFRVLGKNRCSQGENGTGPRRHSVTWGGGKEENGNPEETGKGRARICKERNGYFRFSNAEGVRSRDFGVVETTYPMRGKKRQLVSRTSRTCLIPR